MANSQSKAIVWLSMGIVGAVKSQPVTGEILDRVTHDGTGRNSPKTLFWIQATEELIPASSKYMHTSIYNFRNSNQKYTELLCLSSILISSFLYSKLAGNIHYSLLLIQYCHNSARSPALQADSLPSESTGEPKNTGVGSLSLLQGIFPTQELNRGLLHCRKILYQLSYQGSPLFI